MKPLTQQELERRAEEFDRAVCDTPDIDHFCSSTLWILPAWRAFLPDHKLWAHESEHGFVALGVGSDRSLGSYVHPLEASWALASPFVGPSPANLARSFVELCQNTSLEWDILFLSGINPESATFHELIRGFRGHYSLGLGPSSTRRVASLQGGVDGFLGRRSSKFRANLRRSRRRGRKTGIESEYFRQITSEKDALDLLDRALAVEHQSWKADANTGIIDGPMKTFYRDMLPRLAKRNALRFLFLTLDGKDIAYCFGAVFNSTFRGLQMSYDDEFRQHSPGSLSQLNMIEELCAEGVTSYDLGSDMDYKRRWAEEGTETLAVIVRKI
jgi:hypothetical protein